MPRDTWPVGVGIAEVCHSGNGYRSYPNKDPMLPLTTNNTISRWTVG